MPPPATSTVTVPSPATSTLESEVVGDRGLVGERTPVTLPYRHSQRSRIRPRGCLSKFGEGLGSSEQYAGLEGTVAVQSCFAARHRRVLG